MSEETRVVWENESDANLARSLGKVPTSVIDTIQNDQSVKKALQDGQGVLFKLESERLYAETDNGTQLTKATEFPGMPDATVIAVQANNEQVSLVFDEETRERLNQYQQDKGRSR